MSCEHIREALAVTKLRIKEFCENYPKDTCWKWPDETRYEAIIQVVGAVNIQHLRDEKAKEECTRILRNRFKVFTQNSELYDREFQKYKVVLDKSGPLPPPPFPVLIDDELQAHRLIHYLSIAMMSWELAAISALYCNAAIKAGVDAVKDDNRLMTDVVYTVFNENTESIELTKEQWATVSVSLMRTLCYIRFSSTGIEYVTYWEALRKYSHQSTELRALWKQFKKHLKILKPQSLLKMADNSAYKLKQLSSVGPKPVATGRALLGASTSGFDRSATAASPHRPSRLSFSSDDSSPNSLRLSRSFQIDLDSPPGSRRQSRDGGEIPFSKLSASGETSDKQEDTQPSSQQKVKETFRACYPNTRVPIVLRVQQGFKLHVIDTTIKELLRSRIKFPECYNQELKKILEDCDEMPRTVFYALETFYTLLTHRIEDQKLNSRWNIARKTLKSLFHYHGKQPRLFTIFDVSFLISCIYYYFKEFKYPLNESWQAPLIECLNATTEENRELIFHKLLELPQQPEILTLELTPPPRPKSRSDIQILEEQQRRGRLLNKSHDREQSVEDIKDQSQFPAIKSFVDVKRAGGMEPHHYALLFLHFTKSDYTPNPSRKMKAGSRIGRAEQHVDLPIPRDELSEVFESLHKLMGIPVASPLMYNYYAGFPLTTNSKEHVERLFKYVTELKDCTLPLAPSALCQVYHSLKKAHEGHIIAKEKNETFLKERQNFAEELWHSIFLNMGTAVSSFREFPALHESCLQANQRKDSGVPLHGTFNSSTQSSEDSFHFIGSWFVQELPTKVQKEGQTTLEMKRFWRFEGTPIKSLTYPKTFVFRSDYILEDMVKNNSKLSNLFQVLLQSFAEEQYNPKREDPKDNLSYKTIAAEAEVMLSLLKDKKALEAFKNYPNEAEKLHVYQQIKLFIVCLRNSTIDFAETKTASVSANFLDTINGSCEVIGQNKGLSLFSSKHPLFEESLYCVKKDEHQKIINVIYSLIKDSSGRLIPPSVNPEELPKFILKVSRDCKIFELKCTLRVISFPTSQSILLEAKWVFKEEKEPIIVTIEISSNSNENDTKAFILLFLAMIKGRYYELIALDKKLQTIE